MALEVDTLTGEVKVLDVTAVQDVGKVVHPLFAAGQVEGGVTQGLGWALLENAVWSDGLMINANMTDYTIPTAADVPPFASCSWSIRTSGRRTVRRGWANFPRKVRHRPSSTPCVRHLGFTSTACPLTPEIILPAWEGRTS